jgi:hypothetical protein
MDNVTKRSLQAEMGDAFMDVEGFAAIGLDGEEGFMYLDDYFSKEKHLKNSRKQPQTKWLVTKFKGTDCLL